MRFPTFPHFIGPTLVLWRRGALALAAVFFAFAPAAAKDTYIAPQFDLYITHNKLFRSHMVISGNWLVDAGAFGSAWAEYDLDFGLVPFFRRYLFKDLDAEKSKFVTFRLGYLQVTDLKDDPNGFDEKRPLVEATLRLPMGRAWLFENRSREEFRWVADDYSTRFRNRFRLERKVATHGGFRMTPYGTYEIFYNGKTHDWNEVQAAAGAEIPWRRLILQFEVMGQYVDGIYSSLSYGFTLQKHI